SWTATQKIYFQYYHPDVFCPEPYAQYPSHLHIDLLPRAQGRALGVQMVNRLLDQLIARGSPGVHLGMWAANTRAERFYRKLGFQELTRVGESLYLGRKLARS
ncbi:MAG TPA: GNAT family N-acetyltransferase, partial [Candidatus Nitrosotalea sp.]|nr:GNAT family N-acetyltransferase [Candidatus Nitrosotalea sp.]